VTKSLFLAVCLSGWMSHSFTLTGTNPNFKGWASADVKFAINSANCPAEIDVKKLMEESFAVWNNVSGSRLKLSVVDTTTLTSASDPVTVYCLTTYPAPFTPADMDSVPGFAQNTPSGNYAIAGYVVLNATSGLANISRYNRELLKLIIAHEVGHVLGFGHSQDQNSLMYYDASLKTTLSLAQDDVDAVTYMYPRNELSGDKPMGCALIKTLPPPTGPKGLILIFLIIFPVMISRRLRQKNIFFRPKN
jgi:hypothetical protein